MYLPYKYPKQLASGVGVQHCGIQDCRILGMHSVAHTAKWHTRQGINWQIRKRLLHQEN